MRHSLAVWSGAVAFLVASPVMAADLTPRFEAVPAASSWTGFYIGVHGGGGALVDEDVTIAPADAATQAYTGLQIAVGAQPTEIEPDSAGFLGGAQVGYNHQMGRGLIGIEADFAFSDIQDDETVVTNFVVEATNVAHVDLDWLATVRARAGLLATERVLLFVTGGVAFGEAEAGWDLSAPGNNDFFRGSASETKVGWTAGAGIEFTPTQFLGSQNVSFRADALYFDLGEVDFTTTGSGATAGQGTFDGEADVNGWIARVGVNVRFGTAGAL